MRERENVLPHELNAVIESVHDAERLITNEVRAWLMAQNWSPFSLSSKKLPNCQFLIKKNDEV